MTKSSRLIHESISLPTAAETFSITTKIRHEKVETEIPSSNYDSGEIDATSDLSTPRGDHLSSDLPVPKTSIPQEDFPPFPTMKEKMSRRTTKKLLSVHLTGSPVKNSLLMKQKEKDEKEEQRQQRQLKKVEVRNTKIDKPAKNRTKKMKIAKLQHDFKSSESHPDPYKPDNKACILCGEV
ncbi:hypothetical protein AVEN_12150-1 [Araneus ventricosus]|uniref:Uncharacterized protein n=1 Tax=Araneus ventricosus TaxID=182803 RepID=A0A4Y2LSH3_ARAVE|nr:hypothetical protein AVEN_12150-1 [Araneus ventricosus]